MRQRPRTKEKPSPGLISDGFLRITRGLGEGREDRRSIRLTLRLPIAAVLRLCRGHGKPVGMNLVSPLTTGNFSVPA